MSDELGSLEDVPVRKVWPHEALDFTPWLADHIGELGRAIGRELEVIGVEEPVETFAADILARDVQSGERVLIENQLGDSDHQHLGQLLTYVAGLDASVVVWITTGMRDAHRSAIEWLDRNTGDAISFLAIELTAVRIGTSPIAPLFKVVAAPDSWRRKTSRAASSLFARDHAANVERWKQFWQALMDRHPGEAQRSRAIRPESNRWRELDDLGFVVSMYVATDRVGVFYRGPWGESAADFKARLAPYMAVLTPALGLSEDALEQRFVGVFRRGNLEDPKERIAMIDWLVDAADRLETELRRAVRSAELSA